MKKKELINKINSLIDSLNSMDLELKACLKENAELKSKIEMLASLEREEEEPILAYEYSEPIMAKEELTKETPVEEKQAKETPEEEEPVKETPIEGTKPIKTEDKKPLNVLPVGEKVLLPDSIMEFGAEIIGKIVIESAKYADLVTASASKDKKELLNLIMGKSEVCKAEILNIVTGKTETDVKISLINSQLAEAIDYFKSVVAQI